MLMLMLASYYFRVEKMLMLMLMLASYYFRVEKMLMLYPFTLGAEKMLTLMLCPITLV